MVQSNIAGGHTSVTIRACTDKSCHGYNQSAWNVALITEDQNITQNLAQPADAHSTWYVSLTGQDSGFAAETTDNQSSGVVNARNYTAGFYTCMACHTHVGVWINVTGKPQSFTGNITYNLTGTVVSKTFDFGVNQTDLNYTAINKPRGTSVWTG